MQNFTDELVPLVLCVMGGLISLAAIFVKLDNAQFNAAMGVAGTAIAGAAGLAQKKHSQTDVHGNEQVNFRPTDGRDIQS